MDDSGGVGVAAHHLPAVVDPPPAGPDRAGHVDPGDLPPIPQIPVGAGRVVDDRGVGAEGARDLAAVVDLDGLGPLGPRDIQDGGPAACVAQEAGLAVGDAVGPDPDVLAADLATVVDVEGVLQHAGLGCLDGSVAAPVQHEPGELGARTAGVTGAGAHLPPDRTRRIGGCPGGRQQSGGVGEASQLDAADLRRRPGPGGGRREDCGHGRASHGQAHAAAKADTRGGCHGGLLSREWVGQAMRPIGGWVPVGWGLEVAAVLSYWPTIAPASLRP